MYDDLRAKAGAYERAKKALETARGERDAAIRDAAKYDGNLRQIAKAAGVARQTVYNIIKKSP